MENVKERVMEVWDAIFGKEIITDSFDDQRKREGIKYTVKKHADGKWSCDCPSFVYSSGVVHYHGQLFTCKHIRHFMNKEEDEDEDES